MPVRREHQDGKGWSVRRPGELRQELDSVHPRHVDVTKEEPNILLDRDLFSRVLTVDGLDDLEPCLHEGPRNLLPHNGRVVHDHDLVTHDESLVRSKENDVAFFGQRRSYLAPVAGSNAELNFASNQTRTF